MFRKKNGEENQNTRFMFDKTCVAASWQWHTCVIPEAVIQFRYSWWWAKISLETCRTAKE